MVIKNIFFRFWIFVKFDSFKLWEGKGKVEKRMVEKRMVEKSQGLLCIGPKAILGESC